MTRSPSLLYLVRGPSGRYGDQKEIGLLIVDRAGALLKTLDKRIWEETGLRVSIVGDPLSLGWWARGTC